MADGNQQGNFQQTGNYGDNSVTQALTQQIARKQMGNQDRNNQPDLGRPRWGDPLGHLPWNTGQQNPKWRRIAPPFPHTPGEVTTQ